MLTITEPCGCAKAVAHGADHLALLDLLHQRRSRDLSDRHGNVKALHASDMVEVHRNGWKRPSAVLARTLFELVDLKLQATPPLCIPGQVLLAVDVVLETMSLLNHPAGLAS
jgi:hypothetical protein